MPDANRSRAIATSVVAALLLQTAATVARPESPATTAAPSRPAQEPEQRSVTERGSIERVTVFPSGASVTRALHLELAQGLWEVRVTDLPEGIDPARLQARVREGDGTSASGPRLLGVEYQEAADADPAGSPESVALAERLRDAQRRMQHAEQDRALVAHRASRIEQVGARAAANATNDGGQAASDPAAALRQVAWAHDERVKLLDEERAVADRAEAAARDVADLEATIAQRGAAGRIRRTAVVRVAAPEACAMDLDLTYHVPGASWSPAYAIRAEADRSAATIDCDALVVQRTGEDWRDAWISLSTATPDRSAEPGEVEPVFVDVARAPRPVPGRRMAKGLSAPAKAGAPVDAEAGTAIRATGVAVTYDLPRRLTVPSDADRRQRARIATVEPAARFTWVAEPIAGDAVYLRGDFVNSSRLQFLPGEAEVHMGGEYLGRTGMPSVAPGSSFEVFFGPDRALRATREVVSRVTGDAGLFGGAVATTWKYRVTLDNGTGRDVRVELLDRRPESRNEKVEIKLADLSKPLSTDPGYAAGPQKSGILRWDLDVPASARGTAALRLTWTVQLTHPKDVRTTPLPD